MSRNEANGAEEWRSWMRQTGSPLVIRPYADSDYKAICTYNLPDEQAVYTSMPLQVVEALGEDSLKQPYVIVVDGHLAGFFVLSAHSEVNRYTANLHAVLFKSFSIDVCFQKNGYALQALMLLPGLARRHFPAGNEIILTVHHTNIPAIRLYLKAGFLDKGCRYDGEYGEEWILHLQLEP